MRRHLCRLLLPATICICFCFGCATQLEGPRAHTGVKARRFANTDIPIRDPEFKAGILRSHVYFDAKDYHRAIETIATIQEMREVSVSDKEGLAAYMAYRGSDAFEVGELEVALEY